MSNLLTDPASNVQAIKLTTNVIPSSLTLFPNLKSIVVHPFDNTPEEHTPDWTINPNLRSLTLNLKNFYDLNSILVYRPNLEYLNIKTTASFPRQGENHAFKIDYIILEQFSITFNDSTFTV
ncbi:unnamed protein product [Adineta ricciae]|uniref:Uncharacterized protein n=1 Tax=Adineta ricciae TaxID=249248 RepID=A0A815A855_ADIRI|nr:unnamed protein product [Adineta ricciae]CAF1252452.1 unnamed protein product [Adineta ricciae]